MDLWRRLRFLEHRTCLDYPRCSWESAIKDYKYTPCYYCMGGTLMPQIFHCLYPECKTMWTPENNDWMITLKAQCPFCHRIWNVLVEMKDLKPSGRLIGLPYGSATK